MHLAIIIFGYVLTFFSVALFTWALTPFIRTILDAKPCFVKETTRSSKSSTVFSLQTFIYYYIAPLRKKANPEAGPPTIEEQFSDVILPKEVKDSILDLTRFTCHAREHGNSVRHVIFHGPGGVGKQMTAKKLAQVADIDYAYVSGREINTSGEDAVRQMQTLFSWARLSTDGILLFIDDAEAFLRSSESSLMSDSYTRENNNALCTFLHNTKRIKKNIMLVLATSQGDSTLDGEVLDMCEERIYFPLPDASCRKGLILSYFDTCVQKFVDRNNAAFSIKSKLTQLVKRQAPLLLSLEKDIMSGKQLEDAVAATRGLSGEDIRELMVAMQRELYGSDDKRLDCVSAWKLIEEKVTYHRDVQTTAGEHTLSYLDGNVMDLQDVTFV